MTADGNNEKSFAFQLSNQPFSSRCKDIFSSLDAVERQHEAFEQTRASSRDATGNALVKPDPEDDGDLKCDTRRGGAQQRHSMGRNERKSDYSHDFKTRDHRNRQDRECFHYPVRRPPRRARHTVPDHKKHPEKWTSYSLEDVESGDLSERSNQRAAFDFLAERRKAREEKEEEKFEAGEAACSKGLISFSRPTAKTDLLHRKHGDSVTRKDNVCDELSCADTQPSFEEPTGSGKELRESEFDDKDSNDLDNGHEKTLEKSSAGETGGFKARKNIRRKIRQKESDNDTPT